MVEFLDTQAISSELIKLIREAREKIVIVTYSLDVNLQIAERLKTKSRQGTLSEIVIIYGNFKNMKESNFSRLSEIKDLKMFEKKNLHAKCYLNENRAIITSMNLYEYSQQQNIEMGLLITKKDDYKAYSGLMDEIEHIRTNSSRKKISESGIIESDSEEVEEKISNESFSQEDRKKEVLLKAWRYERSKELKKKAFLILTDKEINEIIKKDVKKYDDLSAIIPKKKVITYGKEIISQINYIKTFNIGKVVSTKYQDDEEKYDKVEIEYPDSKSREWLDTIKEMPLEGQVVAFRKNKTWFNEYIYL